MNVYHTDLSVKATSYQGVSMGCWRLRLSPKILALLRLSINFFSVTINEKVKNQLLLFQKVKY